MAKPGSFNAQDSARRNISPSFSTDKGKTPIKPSENDSEAQRAEAQKNGQDQNDPAKNAEKDLADAEQNAVDQDINESEDLSDINASEESPTSKIINKVASKSLAGKLTASRLKKMGPTGVIVALLFTVYSLMFGAQSLMPFSLVEQLKDKYDGLNVASTLRSNKIFAMQLNRQGIKPATKTKGLFGTKGNYYSLSEKQQKRLANQGIVMEELDLGNDVKKNVLLFNDGSGAQHIITADVKDIELVKSKFGDGLGEIEIGGKKITVDLSDTNTFKNWYNMNTDFRNGYTKESLTWRGSVGHWFDTQTAKFLNLFGITRKIFGNFIKRVQGVDAGNMRQAVVDTIKRTGVQDATVGSIRQEKYDGIDEIETDTVDSETGKKITTTVPDPRGIGEGMPDDGFVYSSDGVQIEKNQVGSFSSNVNGNNLSVAKQKAQQVANLAGNKALSGAMAGAGIMCAGLNVVNVATLISAAQEMVQMIKVATSLTEPTDKVKAGDGDGSLNVIGNGLTEEIPTVIMGDEGVTYQSDSPKSAMMSSGIQSLYTGKAVNPYDPSVASFSFGDIFRSIKSGIVDFAASDFTFYTCSIANIIANTTQAAAAIAGCIVTLGIGCIVSDVVKTGATIALQEIVKRIVVPKLTTKLVSMFARDLISDLAGENWGNAIVSGSHMYMSGNFRNGGGALTNLLSFIAYRTEQEKVLADKAEYERSTRSPFDPTSQHTFLGSIIKQIITLSTYTNGAANLVSGLSSMVNTSILSLMPGAYAANEINEDLIPQEDFEMQCPYLASIGAYGDAFCNPYIITDNSTMDIAPDEIETNPIITESLDENGKIKNGSELSKYVLYCGQRTSPFGTNDTNIANSISEVTPIDGYLGYVPVVGDIIGIVNEEKKLSNMGWITGQECVSSSDNEDWEKNKIYQRYVEDQRLFESMSDSHTSTVSLFLDEYYEDHPLDNSYEGILARFSGRPKDEVVAVLQYQDYLKYVAQYDPSERYVFTNEFNKELSRLIFDAEGDNSVSLLQHNIVYADVRNRAFAVA